MSADFEIYFSFFFLDFRAGIKLLGDACVGVKSSHGIMATRGPYLSALEVKSL